MVRPGGTGDDAHAAHAQPLIPASTLTVTAAFSSGFGIASNRSAMPRKPGKAAIKAPNHIPRPCSSWLNRVQFETHSFGSDRRPLGGFGRLAPTGFELDAV